MKTVVVFRPNSVEDAIQALLESPVDPECTTAVRRVNRSFQYLQSLAYSHIPILNSLILSYRLASQDPFAYRVATWDVPTWFVRHNEELLRVSLMPYHDNDGYPATKNFTTGEPLLFSSATPQAVDATTNTDMPPGMEEILDAQSLFYRGHLDDAVRSAVTAIEVAVEGQISRLLTSQGFSCGQIQDRLKATWNDFDERVRDYERISGTRIPGPVLSPIPYINGVRLKSELAWVRRLRHKIVHEALRVDSGSRGMMLRAIEAMTWLFRWLSWVEGEAEEHSRNYVFFEAMRGLGVPRYPAVYHESGVAVVLHKDADGEIPVSGNVLRAQYCSSIEPSTSDLELFALMSFKYLEIDLDDGPPVGDAAVVERFVFRENEVCTKVFCVESDASITCEIVEAIYARMRDSHSHAKGATSALCVVHHQKSLELPRRAVESAVSEDVNLLGQRFGITIVTALDLRMLVQGVLDYRWNRDAVNEQLRCLGRQGITPPAHRKLGHVNRIFPKLSVMSIELDAQEALNLGDTIGLRLPTRFLSRRLGRCRSMLKPSLRLWGHAGWALPRN